MAKLGEKRRETALTLKDVEKQGLQEILAPLTSKQREYILWRICEFSMAVSMELTKIKKGTYNVWCQDYENFVPVHRLTPHMTKFQDEAMRILRRRTQRKAIAIEEKIIERLEAELKGSQKPMLLKSKLGIMTYDKLLNPVEIQPQVHLSWSERVQSYLEKEQDETKVIEADYSESPERPQSAVLSQGEQAPDKTEEAAEGEFWEITGPIAEAVRENLVEERMTKEDSWETDETTRED